MTILTYVHSGAAYLIWIFSQEFCQNRSAIFFCLVAVPKTDVMTLNKANIFVYVLMKFP